MYSSWLRKLPAAFGVSDGRTSVLEDFGSVLWLKPTKMRGNKVTYLSLLFTWSWLSIRRQIAGCVVKILSKTIFF